MVITCWSVKGGSGTTVTAACLAATAAHSRNRGTLLVDPLGDVPAVLGVDDANGAGILQWPTPPAESPAGNPRSAAGTVAELYVDDRLAVLPRGPVPFDTIDPDTTERLFACLRADGRLAVVDAGTIHPGSPDRGFPGLVTGADRSLLVIRPCYLALRRVARCVLPIDGVVLVEEAGRSLGDQDITSVVGAPVVARIRVEPQIARLVDAGLLCSRLPRSVDRALGDLIGDAP